MGREAKPHHIRRRQPRSGQRQPHANRSLKMRQHIRRAHIGIKTNATFGHREQCILGRDPEIAVHRNPDTAAHHRPVNQRNERFGEFCHAPVVEILGAEELHAAVYVVGLAHLVKRADISARAKRPSGNCADQHSLNRVIGAPLGQLRRHRAHHP